MRIVDQPSLFPHHCAVLPYIGASRGKGFFDTGTDLDRQRVYVSFEAVCEMARLLGWVGPSVRRESETRIAELEAENADIQAQLQDAERQLEAIDFLGSKDFVARQKRGPKKKEPTTAKAA